MRLASLLGVVTLVGCGAAPVAAPVVAAPAMAAVEVVRPVRVPMPPDAPPPPSAVAVQLATMPPLPVDADLPWLQLDVTQRDAIAAYERSLGHGTIPASCASGEVRVGPDAHQQPDDPGPAITVSGAFMRRETTCAITVGEVVACRAALRDQPCRILGEGLAECDAVRQCMEDARAAHEAFETVSRRFCLR